MEESAGSVGLIRPQSEHFEEPLCLDSGRSLAHYDIVFERYGTLSPAGDNAILVCPALSGDHHAAGYHHAEDRKPGWWDMLIGPGKPFDTRYFFVVAISNLGSYRGSTGPSSQSAEKGRPYGPDFPIVTVGDWVRSQKRLMERLDIPFWQMVAGGSLGGMQALQWAIDFPSCVRHALIIAAASRLTAQNIAFNEVARQAIIQDPDFHQGHYYAQGTTPIRGLKLARMLGHITYLSDSQMRDKFGRELRSDRLQFGYGVDFQVESYLRYQADHFADRFDGNTYLLMTKALDYFDPASRCKGDLTKALAAVKAALLLVSFQADWRFPPQRSWEIVKAAVDAKKRVSYANIDADQGHDAFLMPIADYISLLESYMKPIMRQLPNYAA